MKKNNKKIDNSYNNYTYSVTKKSNTINKSITVNDSDSEEDYPKSLSPQKNIQLKNKFLEKTKNPKYLGNKQKPKQNINFPNTTSNKNNERIYIRTTNGNTENFKSPKKSKKFSYFSDSESSSPKLVSINDINKNNKGINNINNSTIKIKKEEDDIIEFPYEFTEKIIEALTCEKCKGIYIKPYVINSIGCMHIFCLGCIIKLLEDKEIGICPTCGNQFLLKNIQYSEVTDYYVKTFFPQIPKIIEENNNMLNQFMESESKKYTDTPTSQYENKNILRCELKANKNNIPIQNRLPDITNKHNKFMIEIKSENDDVVNILKKQTIKRLNSRLREDEIEIRCQNVELSTFKKYKNLTMFLKPNQNGIVTFYYNKKENN